MRNRIYNGLSDHRYSEPLKLITPVFMYNWYFAESLISKPFMSAVANANLGSDCSIVHTWSTCPLHEDFWGTVLYAQSNLEFRSASAKIGMSMFSFLSPGSSPASINSTDVSASSVMREASTEPDVPAPTARKRKKLLYEVYSQASFPGIMLLLGISSSYWLNC